MEEKRVALVVVAAGRGARMGAAINKVYLPLCGQPVLARTLTALDRAYSFSEAALVIAKDDEERARAVLDSLTLSVPVTVVCGGARRSDSVAAGLAALGKKTQVVLVCDAARPFTDRETVLRCVESAFTFGSGVAGVPVNDTIKQVSEEGTVFATPPRETLWAVQTPQAFSYEQLCRAYEQRGESAYTDDAAVMEAAGHPVRIVMGSYGNLKLTTPADFQAAEALLGRKEHSRMRCGFGYDVHRLVEGRALILGGVEIPYELGLLGHSDADVLTHALMDALLGAAGLGDIGQHFPDTDPAYAGISSLVLLTHVGELLRQHHMTVEHCDITVAAQRPKLAPHLPRMAEKLCEALSVPAGTVHIKATTTEGLGFTGRGEGIAAYAVANLQEA